MTEMEKLQRDIQTLQESIRLDWIELLTKWHLPEEYAAIVKHLLISQMELSNLFVRFWTLSAPAIEPPRGA
jgi:hypothetical protein